MTIFIPDIDPVTKAPTDTLPNPDKNRALANRLLTDLLPKTVGPITRRETPGAKGWLVVTTP
jgi:hypothetical protein